MQKNCAHCKIGKFGGCGKFVFNSLLLAQTLDLQTSFFKMTMIHESKLVS